MECRERAPRSPTWCEGSSWRYEERRLGQRVENEESQWHLIDVKGRASATLQAEIIGHSGWASEKSCLGR